MGSTPLINHQPKYLRLRIKTAVSPRQIPGFAWEFTSDLDDALGRTIDTDTSPAGPAGTSASRLPVSHEKKTPRSQKQILVDFLQGSQKFHGLLFDPPFLLCRISSAPKKPLRFFAIAAFFAFVGRQKTSGKGLRNKNTSPMPLWCVFMHQTFVVKPLTNFLPRFVKFGRKFGYDFRKMLATQD